MTHPTSGPQDLTWRRPVSVWWWTRRRTYFVFVMRELSSIFLAWFVVFLLLLLRAVTDGPAAYADFLDRASAPWMVALNGLGALFLVLHVVTWFSLTPQAMALRVRGRPVPGSAVVVAQYAVLAAVSAFIVWLVTS
jgi:fumarate reductase subunit C